MAIASLAGMEMWCGRWTSFSPFIDRRNCAHHVSACAHRLGKAATRAGAQVAAYLHGGQLLEAQRRETLVTFAVCAHCTAGVSERQDWGQQQRTAGDRGLRRAGVCGDGSGEMSCE